MIKDLGLLIKYSACIVYNVMSTLVVGVVKRVTYTAPPPPTWRITAEPTVITGMKRYKIEKYHSTLGIYLTDAFVNTEAQAARYIELAENKKSTYIE